MDEVVDLDIIRLGIQQFINQFDKNHMALIIETATKVASKFLSCQQYDETNCNFEYFIYLRNSKDKKTPCFLKELL